MNTISLSLSHITYQIKKQQHLQLLARQDKIKILVNGVEKTHFQIGIDVSELERRQISRAQMKKTLFLIRVVTRLYGVVHTYVRIIGFRGVQIKQRSRSIYDQQYIYIYQRSYLPSRIQRSLLYLYLKSTRYTRVKILLFIYFFYYSK